MNDKTIFELMNSFSGSSLTEFTLEQGDLKLAMSKETPESVALARAAAEAEGLRAAYTVQAAPAPAAGAAPAPAAAAAPSAPAGETSAAAPAQADSSFEVITSPIVGTFYRSPSPDSPAFAEEGTTLKAGDTLCILEAMKMMNHLEAEFPCRIEKVLVENGSMVEFGAPLFEVTRL